MLFQTMQYILIPALLGAQIILTIILHKGDIAQVNVVAYISGCLH